MLAIPPPSELSRPPVERLIESFFAGMNPNTRRAYARSLEDFRQFAGAPDMPSAAALLLGHGHGHANALGLDYRANLVARDLAANTVNARLAALRSLVALARTLGLVSWELEVKSVRTRPYRDTSGPGTDWFRRAVKTLSERQTPKAARDLAILRLMYDLALRRSSVVGTDLSDLDLDAGTLTVRTKGETDPTTRTLPRPTVEALRRWLVHRGNEPGPLFCALDRARARRGNAMERLSGTSVYRLVRRLGGQLGKPSARPHGLRHAAITAAAKLTGGDIPRIMAFSGHKRPQTVMAYLDNLNDSAGEVSGLVADEI